MWAQAAGAVAADEPIAYQAMYAKVSAAGTAVRWDKFYDVLRFSPDLDAQLETLRHAYKPEEVGREEWHSGMLALLQRVQETFDKAQLGLPASKLRSAHEALGDNGSGGGSTPPATPPNAPPPSKPRKFLPRRMSLPF